ncbi:metal-binding protein [Thermosynechococcaceae cyanobacterium Okahandja]
MPSGRTHDRLTWIAMPMVGFGVGALTADWGWGAIVSSSFGVGGFLLSPDLDTPSLPYYRWGMLRGIWHPYQKLFHHRSFWTHGPILGTLIRLGYLGLWLGLGVSLLGLGIYATGHWATVLPLVQSLLTKTIAQDWRPLGAIALGLELSALLHVSSDTLVSGWRRWRR